MPRMSKPLAMMTAVASHSSILHMLIFTTSPTNKQKQMDYTAQFCIRPAVQEVHLVFAQLASLKEAACCGEEKHNSNRCLPTPFAAHCSPLQFPSRTTIHLQTSNV
ncbi:hypothetical protein XENORESO_000909 [Xenotaenia resolanae]|uniref:Secreted protein n=1 Tax=Xenotaenia resolanae TaxID=208358 RepID=A0ABV0VU46_9TELE